MITDYRDQAEYLIKTTADLQKKVLIKHTASILEEIHDQIQTRDNEIERLRNALQRIANDCTARKAVMIAKNALNTQPNAT